MGFTQWKFCGMTPTESARDAGGHSPPYNPYIFLSFERSMLTKSHMRALENGSTVYGDLRGERSIWVLLQGAV